MERLRKLGEIAVGIETAVLKLAGITVQHPEGREERVEAMAEFIRKAKPQRSIKIVCSGEELGEVAEALGRAGFIEYPQDTSGE